MDNASKHCDPRPAALDRRRRPCRVLDAPGAGTGSGGAIGIAAIVARPILPAAT
jgi:hypothetical protein